MWMYLSSQLSLRLHGMHSFHSYAWIIRSGGLIDALGPEVARREVDEDGNLTIQCQGFNDRNFYPRETPCDQDYLRKLARDTSPDELERWYNEQAAVLFAELGAYDSEGLFIGDGTYLFIPDNPRYEGSQRLLFDEHNHPVSQEKEKQMTPAQRDRCRWRRFYKAVLLLHCDAAGERFVVAGIHVLREGESEATALWPLVETFVEKLPGVMKVLLLDRGFINGPRIGGLKTKHGIDTVIPIRGDMDILADVRGLTQLESTVWEAYEPTHRPSLPPLKSADGTSRATHPVVEKRERKRQETLAAKRAAAAAENAPDPSHVREQTWIARFPQLTSW